jgi:hypothetical protein
MEEAESQIHGLHQDLRRLHEEVREGNEAQRAILETLRQELERQPEAQPDIELPRFRKFTFEGNGPDAPAVHIPAGSFGDATLLTGVYAPVNDEALPVLMRLDAALVGPARSHVPVRDAFLVGKAQGDANSQRATIQIQTLSYVTRSGRTVEIPVNGWVVDIDGIQGLAGTYVWRAEELATLAAASGGLAAGAEALAAGETTATASPLGSVTSMTGSPLRFSASRAASGALQKISEIIARRMEEITPAVYVPNAKPVTVAFISGATLTDLAIEEEEDDVRANPFSGLDPER